MTTPDIYTFESEVIFHTEPTPVPADNGPPPDPLILLAEMGVMDWTVTATPTHLDVASASPPETPTATLVDATGTPLATFWSYLMKGALNAAGVVARAQHVHALLSDELDEDAWLATLETLPAPQYADWWPGFTPSYLRAKQPHAVTVRTPHHTEELATVWTARADHLAHALCVVVNTPGAQWLAHRRQRRRPQAPDRPPVRQRRT